MARSHVRFSVDAWRDEDWTDLSMDAQWLFVALLSQPKLTLVGSIDITLSKWANLSATTTYASVDQALAELEERRFVVIDHRTEELLIRSFTKNDLAPSRLSPQVAKGFWGAWKSVMSTNLRRQVVDNCPPDLWERLAPHAPPDAVQNRRSSPIDRDRPSPIDSESHDPIDTPVSCLLSPVSSLQQQRERSSTRLDEPVESVAAAASASPSDTFAEALEILVARTVSRRPARSNPAGYERSLRNGKRNDHEDAAHAHLERDPDLTAEALADLLEPGPSSSAGEDESVRRRRAFEALSNPECDDCHGSTWLDAPLQDDGSWGTPEPCPTCHPEFAR